MEFLLIATAHFVALLSPGPDFFLIVQAASKLRQRLVFSLCAGIAAANGAYLVLAVLGLEAVREMNLLATILKYCGALYLFYLGILLLRAPRNPVRRQSGYFPLDRATPGHQFLLGFLSALLNPKNMIFYLSLFTSMVSPATGLITRGLYGAWMTMVVLCWDCLVATVAHRTLAGGRLEKSVYYVEKGSGAILCLLGISLPFA